MFTEEVTDLARRAPFASGRTLILLVEDEILVRMMISDELRDAGYDVLEAFNGDEALVILQTQTRVDLIISDVRMPGSVDGLGLLARVKAIYPRIPMIIMSGHLEPTFALAQGATQFLAKPFAMNVVVNAVRHQLDGHCD
jgi:CheY-like chemotaxis protein